MRLLTFYANGWVPVDFLGDRKAVILLRGRMAVDLLRGRTAVDLLRDCRAVDSTRGGLPAVYLNHES